ncbi:MAG: hypothetical protein M9904_05490 [Chitinophagaceae bacterium]|nr:hypothetical protein [Chitinophagaceae bacterium]
MRKLFPPLLVIAIAMTAFNSNAQVKAVNQASQKVAETNASISNATNTVATTASTVKTTVSTLKDLVGVKNKSKAEKATPSIFIAGIKSDNASLLALQKALEGTDDVKKVSKAYKDGIVTLTIELGKKASLSSVWDKVSTAFTTNFELAEMDDNSIVLAYTAPEQQKALSKQ